MATRLRRANTRRLGLLPTISEAIRPKDGSRLRSKPVSASKQTLQPLH